jgi:aryl-alcohol dehydrogenase-like predicted oxidoreductase
MRRRSFATTLLSLVAGLGIRPERSSPPPGTLPTRPLGRTGLDVTILGLGGHHVSVSGSEPNARRLVEAALEEGINFFDTAESYGGGSSEAWLGKALAGVRKSVVLMTKTYAPDERSAESARRHLEGSLSRLNTDYLDLWQLHSVRSPDDVDRAFGPGGAMEFITEARSQGTVRFIGVTGHVTPAAHRRALEYWDRGIKFDVMQMPLNPLDYHQQSFTREVLPMAVDRGIGVIAMKTSADGALLREGLATIDECQRYVWSLPVSLAVVGMERPELVRENASRAREFRAMSEADIAALRSRLEPRAQLALEWYKK